MNRLTKPQIRCLKRLRFLSGGEVTTVLVAVVSTRTLNSLERRGFVETTLILGRTLPYTSLTKKGYKFLLNLTNNLT